ncbi:MAG: polysaccharide deacetylase family protein [Rhodanobacter sp.]
MKFMLKKQHLLNLLPDALMETHGPKHGSVRFLSFDDGPHPEHTPRLLDLLATHGIHASFFVVGNRAEKYPNLVERIVAEGHLLGNHSWSHNQFGRMKLREQVAELDRTDSLLANFDHYTRHRVRPPQGILPLPLLLHLARKRRRIAYWSYDSMDYLGLPPAELAAKLRGNPPRVGDIVLMHDDGPRAGEALAMLLPQWRSEGYDFHAMLSEMT